MRNSLKKREARSTNRNKIIKSGTNSMFVDNDYDDDEEGHLVTILNIKVSLERTLNQQQECQCL